MQTSGIWSRLYGLLTQSKICAPRKCGPKFTKIAYDLLPPKSPHRAKFHRDRSNQLGEKRYKNWASGKNFLSRQKRDYLSRVRAVREARLKTTLSQSVKRQSENKHRRV